MGQAVKTISLLLVPLLAVIGACTDAAGGHETPASPSVASVGEPEPKLSNQAEQVGEAGGTVRAEGITVEIPPSAASGNLSVRFGGALGLSHTGFTMERFGVPVEIQHEAPISKPIRLAWDVSQLSVEERSTLGLVRWNVNLGVWAPVSAPVTFHDGWLKAEVSEFSIITWMSNAAAWGSQVKGEVLGTRAKAGPKCSGEKLPSWVRNVVRPDETESTVPIRTCLEPDKDGVITVRIVNNRPYSQKVSVSTGEFAWSWVKEENLTAAGSFRYAVNRALSNNTSLVLGPVGEIAVGIARPTSPGSVSVRVSAAPSLVSVCTDLLFAAVAEMVDLDNVRGFDSEVANLLVQALYDCGGKRLLESREVSLDPALVREAFQVIQQCSSNAEVTSAMESIVRARLNRGGGAGLGAAKAYRLFRAALGKFKMYLKVAHFASYTSELSAGVALGEFKVGIYGNGVPPPLGSWSPTCTDPAVDTDRLFKNLVLQDDYMNLSKDYWEFESWLPNSKKAVQPLRPCSKEHVEKIAAELERSMDGQRSAEILAGTLRETFGISFDRIPDWIPCRPAEWAARAEKAVAAKCAGRLWVAFDGNEATRLDPVEDGIESCGQTADGYVRVCAGPSYISSMGNGGNFSIRRMEETVEYWET